MKLFLVRQEINDDYDTYDSIIVAAKDEFDAQEIKPLDAEDNNYGSWVKSVDDLIVTEIGTAKKGTQRGIILESFNAG